MNKRTSRKDYGLMISWLPNGYGRILPPEIVFLPSCARQKVFLKLHERLITGKFLFQNLT